MSTKFAFHGGVHPPENKRQSTGGPIQVAPVPERLVVPLSQHIGAPSEVVVNVGDKVLKGQVISEAVGRLSVNVHAPSSGVVEAIESRPVPHISGMTAPCIIIKTDGQDQWCEHQGLEDYQSISKQELLDFIRFRGISGMGGAGFPTDVKLHLGDDHIVNTLVINAMECEPYITADDMLMREHADQVVKGIEIIAHLLKPHHVMIGTEDNKPQAIRAMEQAVAESKLDIDIIVVPTVYPSGGEKQLIKLLTGVEVPSGKIPADVGIVCQNVGTASAIYDAVYNGVPLISRIVTLTGDALGHPHNMRALIGTPLETLLQAAEVKDKELYRLVIGGPMMGFTVDSQSIPMIKTTNCVIAATYDEMPPAPAANPCIRCGMCEQVCPAELLPQQLHWFAKGKEFEKAKHHNLFDCIECGACSYVCPSNIPLVQYYRFAKSEIRAEEAEQRKADHARMRFEARQERLEREKEEKALRRKQRAEEAAKAQAVKKDKASQTTEKATNSGEPDLRALKTAAAVARTKLKKAQKALQLAEEKGVGDIDKLRQTVTELEAKEKATQEAYDQAQSAPAPAPVVDIKQLKTNAAVARTKLKQAEKALAKAEESGEGDIEALKAKLVEQQAKTEKAQAAYDQAESGNAPQAAAPVVNLDELKETMDAAQSKVDKAQKALDAAIASGSPAVEKMKAGVEKLQGKYEEAKAEYDKAISSAAPAQAATANIDELKADMDAIQAKVEKAQKALDAAIASGSPAVDKMKAGVEKLQGKYEEAKAEYERAISSAAPAQAATVNIDELKADMDAIQAKVEKAQKALDAAIASGSPAAEKMKAGVEKLQGKYEEAKAEYEKALEVQPQASSANLDELKADMETMQGKVEKAQKALDAALASGSPAAEKMKAGVEKLQGKYEELKQEFVSAGGQINEPEPEKAIDPKALKQNVSIMRTKLKKAQAALDESEDDTELQAEVERLSKAHDEAKAAFDAYEKEQIDKAAAEGVDLKQLKIDAAMARAAVTKAERALDKAREAQQDDLPEIEQQLMAAQQEAEKLNQTLNRFTH
ncbi:electron transport complex subunit RsxC [Neptuniibacter caesariensis]|uniref:Ion-translocating oxidoreductase complex subunit C n=1 Tax=Neptuniibacter caesariensis TaxID=207954 RepID=A0A7U8C9N9_NEPCE|nr:electron transport complex subunit RsxC [Neptuniibacter caesariensis]EAR62436.1 electron transport complex protein RnfC [Oceanospirillum sp. MED92] [Neptuniibacter caesariensis]